MASQKPKSRVPRHAGGAFNPRKATAPIAAFTMAIILYVYSTTSIRAAKRNAQLHREADGGQVDMRRESLRRHGMLDKVEGTKGFELFRDAKPEVKEESEKAMGANKAQPLTVLGPRDDQGATRTQVESGLQSYKSSLRKLDQEKGE